MITINVDACLVCGGCIDICPKTAILMVDDNIMIDYEKCGECKICVEVCPVNAPIIEEA